MEKKNLIIEGVYTLRKLTETNDYWIKSPEEGRDVLDEDKYQRHFPLWTSRNKNKSTEASRASALVKMYHLHLAQRLAQLDWSYLFPHIVAKEEPLKLYPSSASSEDNPHGALRAVSIEMQAASPVLPNRKFSVVRYCTQIDQATWLITDVSHVASPNTYHRLPSGCLIQRITDYVSKVTWVEHSEAIPVSLPNHTFYNHLIRTGFTNVAERMVASLQISLDRMSHESLTISMFPKVPWLNDMLTLMEFGEIMVRGLFENVFPNEDRNSTLRKCVCYSEDFQVYASLYKSPANFEVAAGQVTFGVRHSPDFVLETLGDERTLLELDEGLTKVCAYRKYPTGGDPRNNIFVSSMIDGRSNEMFIREVNVNRSGSLVLWSTISLKAFDVLSHTKGLPKDSMLISGFSITAATNTGGSVITLVLRKLVEGNRPLQEKRQQSIESITFAINQTVGRVKEALEKHQPPSPGGDRLNEKQQVGADDIASEILQDELGVLKLN